MTERGKSPNQADIDLAIEHFSRAADLLQPEPTMGGPKGRQIGPITSHRAWVHIDDGLMALRRVGIVHSADREK